VDDWSVPAESTAAIRGLVAAHPILRPVLDEHVRLCDEILPNVVMAEIARHVGTLVADRGDDPVVIHEVEAIIRTLDAQLLNGADSVKNVVAVSFIGHLPSTGEPGAEVRELLTPALRTVFDQVN
jgi:hypothetical protein